MTHHLRRTTVLSFLLTVTLILVFTEILAITPHILSFNNYSNAYAFFTEPRRVIATIKSRNRYAISIILLDFNLSNCEKEAYFYYPITYYLRQITVLSLVLLGKDFKVAGRDSQPCGNIL